MHTLIFESPVPDTVAALQTAFGNCGMLLLCNINGQVNAAKIGETVPPVRILEVFRPELAVRVWRTHPPAGIDIPVRLYIYENANGHAVVNYRSLLTEMSRYGFEELTDVGRKSDEIFARIIQETSTVCGKPLYTTLN